MVNVILNLVSLNLTFLFAARKKGRQKKDEKEKGG